MEASERTASPPYFAFKTLTNTLVQMEEHGPPNRIDRSFLAGMSGAGQTQFIHGLKSLGLIADDGTVQPELVAMVTEPENRPELLRQIIRRRYPEAVELGRTNATTGQLVDVFRDVYGVQGDTARKAIAFYLAAAKYVGDIPLSPNFKTPTVRTGTGTRKRGRPLREDPIKPQDEQPSNGIPNGLHPALSGLLADLPKRGQTWTRREHDDFIAAFNAILRIAAPIRDDDPDEPEGWDEDDEA